MSVSRFSEAVARHYALLGGKVMLAPLVGGSELPYRLLCREYGAETTFTEMCVAEYYLEQGHKYHKSYTFQFSPADQPCLLQLAGCDAASLLALARAPELAGHVAALNINAGCPQSFAMEKGYGAGMWARPDHMVALMRELVAACPLPVSMKVRLHESPATTIRIMGELVGAGVSAFIVHPRYWWQKGSRAGQADWAALAQIRAAFPAIPIIGNGGVSSYAEIAALRAQTGVDGVMIGYPALTNPAIFSPQQPPLSQMISRFVYHCRAIRTPWIDVLRHVAWMLPKGTEKEPLFNCKDLVSSKTNRQEGLKAYLAARPEPVELWYDTEAEDNIVYWSTNLTPKKKRAMDKKREIKAKRAKAKALRAAGLLEEPVEEPV